MNDTSADWLGVALCLIGSVLCAGGMLLLHAQGRVPEAEQERQGTFKVGSLDGCEYTLFDEMACLVCVNGASTSLDCDWSKHRGTNTPIRRKK